MSYAVAFGVQKLHFCKILKFRQLNRRLKPLGFAATAPDKF